jgi:zinc/manganese transport system substrate-binding protein
MKILLVLLSLSCALCAAEPLRVCTSIPDLGNLAQQIGGTEVSVTVFARSGDDPHFVEARPSHTRALSDADVLMVVGLELEIGWIPILQQQARNSRILPGGSGFIDASDAITPIGIPAPDTDRSHGDIHAGGNPHYLSDPVCGLQVAQLITQRFIALAPERRAHFERQWHDFARRMAVALFGEARGQTLASDEVIAQAQAETRQPQTQTGGWFGALHAYRGAAIVTDHDAYPYFAQRFGLRIVGFLEPKPGIAPTTSHLTHLLDLIRVQNVRGIITSPYFDKRSTQLIATQSNKPLIRFAHQVGAQPHTDDYLRFIDHNVKAIAAALTP